MVPARGRHFRQPPLPAPASSLPQQRQVQCTAGGKKEELEEMTTPHLGSCSFRYGGIRALGSPRNAFYHVLMFSEFSFALLCCYHPNAHRLIIRTTGNQCPVLVRSHHTDPFSMPCESLHTITVLQTKDKKVRLRPLLTAHCYTSHGWITWALTTLSKNAPPVLGHIKTSSTGGGAKNPRLKSLYSGSQQASDSAHPTTVLQKN